MSPSPPRLSYLATPHVCFSSLIHLLSLFFKFLSTSILNIIFPFITLSTSFPSFPVSPFPPPSPCPPALPLLPLLSDADVTYLSRNRLPTSPASVSRCRLRLRLLSLPPSSFSVPLLPPSFSYSPLSLYFPSVLPFLPSAHLLLPQLPALPASLPPSIFSLPPPFTFLWRRDRKAPWSPAGPHPAQGRDLKPQSTHFKPQEQTSRCSV